MKNVKNAVLTLSSCTVQVNTATALPVNLWELNVIRRALRQAQAAAQSDATVAEYRALANRVDALCRAKDEEVGMAQVAVGSLCRVA